MFQDLHVQKYILVSNTHLCHLGLQGVKFKMEPRRTSSLTALYLFVCLCVCAMQLTARYTELYK
jgi:hypothetical protein